MVFRDGHFAHKNCDQESCVDSDASAASEYILAYDGYRLCGLQA